MGKIINVVGLFIIFINMNDTYKAIGVLVGLQSATVFSVGTILFMVIYIWNNFSIFKKLWVNQIFFRWVFLILIFPIISLLLSFIFGYLTASELIYWASFNSLFGMLLIGSAILAIKVPIEKLKLLAWLSVGTTIIGFIINYTLYSFTQKMLLLSGSKIATQTELYRALSFFQNPNAAAFTIVLYFIIIYTSSSTQLKSYFTYFLCFLVMATLVFITGSRTSLILVFIIAILYLMPLMRKSIIAQNAQALAQTNAVMVLIGVLALLSFFIILPLIGGNAENIFSENLIGRFNVFFDLANSGGVQDDSLTARSTIISKYFNYIFQNPIFGYGPVFVRDKIDSGEFENVSQNAFIEGTIIFGVVYAILFIRALFLTYFYSSNRSGFKDYYFNPFKVFIVFLFLLSFSINGIFWFKSITIILGFLIGTDLKLQQRAIENAR